MDLSMISGLVMLGISTLLSFYIKTINDGLNELKADIKGLRGEMQSKEMAKMQSDNLYLLVNTLKSQIESIENRLNKNEK